MSGHLSENKTTVTQRKKAELITAQDGKCLICACVLRNDNAYQSHMDHCHECNTVRGVLCNKCNTGLGKFDDNPILLARAIVYLKRHFRKQVKQNV